ncbi:MAG: hypothetical protein Q4E33_01605 [Erysipelotrichaceae bacterium]|nr:hypothetical protein [Erysipelotrichaceae bacterium]
MKKIIIVLLCFILLGCDSEKKEDYYVLSFDDYTISVGYDNVEYTSLIFDFELPEVIPGFEEVKDVNVSFLGKDFGIASFINEEDEENESKEAIISSLSFYLKDVDASSIKINDIELDKSIKKNCETFNGNLIEKNGYACVIEQEVHDKDDVVILYGDILNLDQDTVDRIEIRAK